MKRIVFYSVLMVLLGANFLPIYAQKKEISQAKAAVKKGVNLEQARDAIKDLLKDSIQVRNENLWNALYEVLNKQYEQGNEKLYLKQKYDTTQLFLLSYDLLKTLEKQDSVQTLVSSKKSERSKMLDKNAELFHTYRPNLVKGGMFFISKQRYADAYKLLDAYINTAYMPLFSRYNYEETDTYLTQAAYLSAYCGYKMEDAKRTLKHAYLALKDSTHYAYVLQFLAEAYHIEKDFKRYENALKDGFSSYPNFPFFFSRLLAYYLDNEQYVNALSLIEQAAQIEGEKEEYLLAKTSVLFELKRFDDCISLGERLLAENDELAEAHLNVGLSYYNKGVMLDKSTISSAKQETKIKIFYQKALPHLETFRKMEPKGKDKWAYPLYIIYLSLNMGNEFDEIDKILRSKL